MHVNSSGDMLRVLRNLEAVLEKLGDMDVRVKDVHEKQAQLTPCKIFRENAISLVLIFPAEIPHALLRGSGDTITEALPPTEASGQTLEITPAHVSTSANEPAQTTPAQVPRPPHAAADKASGSDAPERMHIKQEAILEDPSPIVEDVVSPTPVPPENSPPTVPEKARKIYCLIP